ncbi:MAG TPA: bestrophin family ion channel [Blastocatellia bacterium]|jgi:ion channel-forming bestrophin family protein|nr:bestrophin family ion channel [Blastocatellia bacterium]
MLVNTHHIWRRVLRAHRRRLVGIFLLSLLVTVLYTRFGMTQLAITTVPLTIVGVALSILLGFRNNEAYNRYWEARTLWGGLVNSSRTFARLVLTLIPPCVPNGAGPACATPEHAAYHREMVYRVIAFAHALRCHLRRQDPFGELAPLIAAGEVEALRGERNVPAALLHTLGERVRDAWQRGWVQDFHLIDLHATLTEMTNVQGGCERIKNTPIPLTYTYVSNKIVLAYCLALPFGLVETLGAATPVVVIFISFTFLTLDRFGKLIEDPFCTTSSGLPLGALSRTVEVNLRQRLGERDLPPDVEPAKGVLM